VLGRELHGDQPREAREGEEVGAEREARQQGGHARRLARRAEVEAGRRPGEAEPGRLAADDAQVGGEERDQAVVVLDHVRRIGHDHERDGARARHPHAQRRLRQLDEADAVAARRSRAPVRLEEGLESRGGHRATPRAARW